MNKKKKTKKKQNKKGVDKVHHDRGIECIDFDPNNMYEVAQVAGNKVEAACALQSLSSIMGISSSHHGGSHSSSGSKHSNNHHSHRKPSFGHADERETMKKQQIYNRDLQKIRESYKRTKDAPLTDSSSSGSSNVTNDQNTGASGTSGTGSGIRPITISEMNAYNAEKSNESTNSSINKNNNSLVGTNDSLIKTHTTSNKKKEFYKVGEGYHKTDSCYYKTADGGFHKLPPDSYHKMSEICYNKMPDGSFKRLDDLLQNGNTKSTDSGTANNSHPNKVRNQMIRFLKRSKSHTPATIKEMQKAKERDRRPNNIVAHRIGTTAGAANVHSSGMGGATANQQTNRKVVVTMMENGGLPIVATSKTSSKRDHSTRDNKEQRSKEKVKRITYQYQFIRKFYNEHTKTETGTDRVWGRGGGCDHRNHTHARCSVRLPKHRVANELMHRHELMLKYVLFRTQFTSVIYK